MIARGDIQAMEQSKTSDPMYAIWSQALETRPNTVVEAIVPGLVGPIGLLNVPPLPPPTTVIVYCVPIAFPLYIFKESPSIKT